MDPATLPTAPARAPAGDAGAHGPASRSGDLPRAGRAPASRSPAGIHRIGPNALIQTRRALVELQGEETAAALYREAGCPAAPTEMVDEEHFVRLVVAVRDALGEEGSARVLARSGYHTAEYVHEHRIPRLVRRGVELLPTGIGLWLLLGGIRRHAWTFVGGGSFESTWGEPPTVRIRECPTCRGIRLERPGGAFYSAAFQALLGRLLNCAVRVEERSCAARGDPFCTFTIDTGVGAGEAPDLSHGGNPCAS